MSKNITVCKFSPEDEAYPCDPMACYSRIRSILLRTQGQDDVFAGRPTWEQVFDPYNKSQLSEEAAGYRAIASCAINKQKALLAIAAQAHADSLEEEK